MDIWQLGRVEYSYSYSIVRNPDGRKTGGDSERCSGNVALNTCLSIFSGENLNSSSAEEDISPVPALFIF